VPCAGFGNSPALNTYRESGRELLISVLDLDRHADLCAAAARKYLTSYTFPDRKFTLTPSFIL
jgi:hypothetical protein